VGAGTIIVTGALELSGVLATQHFVADAPQTCARSDCAFAKVNLYGTGLVGTCTPQGADGRAKPSRTASRAIR
jgi:hypothetical protein